MYIVLVDFWCFVNFRVLNVLATQMNVSCGAWKGRVHITMATDELVKVDVYLNENLSEINATCTDYIVYYYYYIIIIFKG